MKLSRSIFVMSVLLFSSPGFAGRGGGGPCVEDARKLCAGVSALGGQLQECLKKHMTELSPSCKAQYGERADSVKGAAAAVKDSCAAEIQKWCKGVSPLGGGLQKCVKENANNLSEGCRGSMESLKGSFMPK
jgi:hypothetical protein